MAAVLGENAVHCEAHGWFVDQLAVALQRGRTVMLWRCGSHKKVALGAVF